MIPRLQYLFDRLETDRLQLMNAIEQIPMEKFHEAAAGKWSIQQIMAHLLTAEKLSLQYMQKKILGIKEAPDSGVLEEVKMTALWISQWLPFKFRAPNVVVALTPSFASVAELGSEWSREREHLSEFLEAFEQDQLKKMIYKHVRVGMMNIQHALLFTRAHFLHHLPQIKRQL